MYPSVALFTKFQCSTLITSPYFTLTFITAFLKFCFSARPCPQKVKRIVFIFFFLDIGTLVGTYSTHQWHLWYCCIIHNYPLCFHLSKEICSNSRCQMHAYMIEVCSVESLPHFVFPHCCYPTGLHLFRKSNV